MKYKNKLMASSKPRIEVEYEGEKFWLKPMSFGAACNALSNALKTDENGEKPRFDAGENNRAKINDSLLDWTLKDEETGKKIPICPETIADLDEDCASELVKRLAKKEKKNEEELGN